MPPLFASERLRNFPGDGNGRFIFLLFYHWQWQKSLGNHYYICTGYRNDVKWLFGDGAAILYDIYGYVLVVYPVTRYISSRYVGRHYGHIKEKKLKEYMFLVKVHIVELEEDILVEVHIEHIVVMVQVHILEENILVMVHMVNIVDIMDKDIVVVTVVHTEDIVEVTVEFMVEVIEFYIKKYMIKHVVVIKRQKLVIPEKNNIIINSLAFTCNNS